MESRVEAMASMSEVDLVFNVNNVKVEPHDELVSESQRSQTEKGQLLSSIKVKVEPEDAIDKSPQAQTGNSLHFSSIKVKVEPKIVDVIYEPMTEVKPSINVEPGSEVDVFVNPIKLEVDTANILSDEEIEFESKGDGNQFKIETECIARDEGCEKEKGEKDETIPTTESRRYNCDDCNKTFSFISSLRRHRTICHRDKLYTCEVCEKSFPLLGELQRHLRSHTRENHNKCDNVCSKNSTYLKEHMQAHREGTHHNCGVRSKKFTPSHLTLDTKIHSGEKIYTCNVCGKMFTQSGDLDSHMQLHTEKRPYNCDVCNKKFTHMGYLKSHMHVHNREKPYKCDACNKTFSLIGFLKSHMKYHCTVKADVNCDVCGKKCCDSDHSKLNGAGDRSQFIQPGVMKTYSRVRK